MDHGQTTNSKNILTKEPKIMKTQNNNSRLRKKQQRPKTQIQDSKKWQTPNIKVELILD